MLCYCVRKTLWTRVYTGLWGVGGVFGTVGRRPATGMGQGVRPDCACRSRCSWKRSEPAMVTCQFQTGQRGVCPCPVLVVLPGLKHVVLDVGVDVGAARGL